MADHNIGHLKIKKGTIVQSFFSAPMRNEKFFDNPEVFDVERWRDPNRQVKDPFHYTPFSIGPRNC